MPVFLSLQQSTCFRANNSSCMFANVHNIQCIVNLYIVHRVFRGDELLKVTVLLDRSTFYSNNYISKAGGARVEGKYWCARYFLYNTNVSDRDRAVSTAAWNLPVNRRSAIQYASVCKFLFSLRTLILLHDGRVVAQKVGQIKKTQTFIKVIVQKYPRWRCK